MVVSFISRMKQLNKIRKQVRDQKWNLRRGVVATCISGVRVCRSLDHSIIDTQYVISYRCSIDTNPLS